MNNTERLEWVDGIKGLAIICMLISHAIPGYTNPIKNWITAFNMPLFFVLTGYLKATKKHQYYFNDIGHYSKKQFFSIIIPYFVFCLLYTLLIFLLAVYSSGISELAASELKENLRNTFLFIGVQSMWFIPIYIYSGFLYDFGINKLNGKWKRIVLIVLIAILLILNRQSSLTKVIRMLGKIIGAIVFLLIGELFAKIDFFVSAAFDVCSLIIFSFLAIWNGFVSMNFEYGRVPVLFFINACGLSFLLCGFLKKSFKRIRPNIQSFLDLYGKYTIVILVTNNTIIEIARLADHKFTGDFFLSHGNAGFMLFALLLTVLEYPMIMLAQGRLSFVFGKKRVHGNCSAESTRSN